MSLIVLIRQWHCDSDGEYEYEYVAVCVSELHVFFLWVRECFCSGVCLVIKLSYFHWLTGVHFCQVSHTVCAHVFGHYHMVGLCDSYCHIFK
jgi:hypothetical protein